MNIRHIILNDILVMFNILYLFWEYGLLAFIIHFWILIISEYNINHFSFKLLKQFSLDVCWGTKMNL